MVKIEIITHSSLRKLVRKEMAICLRAYDKQILRLLDRIKFLEHENEKIKIVM